MPPTDAVVLTLSGAAAAIKSEELSPVMLLEHVLDRIARHDPALNAFLSVDAEAARAAALQAERQIRGGSYKGPLHGIPVALKDNIDAVGFLTTSAAADMFRQDPTSDATVTARLRGAGAIVVGKLNMHELAFGLSTSSEHFGRAGNPWDIRLSPGGSSGGAGAAIAAGLCLGAIGTDTGGSVRLPAALCGVTGLRPTFGLVGRSGIRPLAPSLDTAGPLARTADDCALLLDAMSGHDPDDPDSVTAAISEPAPAIPALRIGVLDDDLEGADPDVLANWHAAVRTLEAAGARVVRVSLGLLDDLHVAVRLVNHVEAAAQYGSLAAGHPDQFGEDVAGLLAVGASYSADQRAAAQEVLAAFRAEFADIFADVDVVMCPTTPFTAEAFSPGNAADVATRNAPLLRYTVLASAAGTPALSVPSGFSRKGLPTGVQILGPVFGDRTVLMVGANYQRLTGWHEAVPPIGAPKRGNVRRVPERRGDGAERRSDMREG